jgi:hypothetical protein
MKSEITPLLCIDANGLQGWRIGHRGCPHQAEQRGWTGREPQTDGESGTCVPAEGHADRPQDGHQSTSFSRICCHKFWQALREDTALTARILAHEFPYPELEANRACAPGEVRQVALITTMDGQ